MLERGTGCMRAGRALGTETSSPAQLQPGRGEQAPDPFSDPPEKPGAKESRRNSSAQPGRWGTEGSNFWQRCTPISAIADGAAEWFSSAQNLYVCPQGDMRVFASLSVCLE